MTQPPFLSPFLLPPLLPWRRLSRLLSLLLLAFVGLASAYPDKPVTIVVPFSAGGPTDKVARDLGAALGAVLKQAVVIENVGGAGGTLGANRVAKAAPDGHTLLLYHIGMATSAALYRNLPYQPLEDFEYLGMINEVPMTLIGRPTLPADSYADLVAWLDANKGKVNLAHAGLGAASHLCGLLFQQAIRTDMTTVPYKGTAPAMSDLLGGQVDLMCDQTTNTTGPIASKNVKAFAVTSMKPLAAPALARLPTLHSQGLQGFDINVWHGLYAPRGTPPAVVARLNAALRVALKDADFIQKQEALGAVVVTDARLTPAGHRRFVAAETRKWALVIKSAGPYAD